MTSHFIHLIAFLNQAWFLPLMLVFIVFSLTRIMIEDTLFDRPRNWFFDRFPHDGYTTKRKPKRGTYMQVSNGYWTVTKGTYLGKLMSCAWCAGFWVSLIVFAAAMISPLWTLLIGFPLGLRVLPALFPGWD